MNNEQLSIINEGITAISKVIVVTDSLQAVENP
jgi:hypothetical protein